LFISEASTDPVRLKLAAESAKWFRDLLISGGIVAFGCLLEIWETAVSLRKWFRARRGFEEKENPRSWGIPIAAIGLLLVVGGVVGEVVYEGLSSNADAKLQSHESNVLSVAEITASQAQERAAVNEKEAARLRKQAEDEALTRATLETEFVKEEPRITLLNWHKSQIVKRLLPFAGQKFAVLSCLQGTDTEGIRTYSFLQITLAFGAKWTSIFGPNSSLPGKCTAVGVFVSVPPNATKVTRDNAKALFSVLRGVLKTGVEYEDTENMDFMPIVEESLGRAVSGRQKNNNRGRSGRASISSLPSPR
jgi:hypothetical protein